MFIVTGTDSWSTWAFESAAEASEFAVLLPEPYEITETVQ